MAPPWSQLLASACLLSLLLQCSSATAADDDSDAFVRPPPKRLVYTAHTKSDTHPEQVHVSMVGADHMRVTYVTANKHVPSTVEYGREPGRYDASATGESTSYRYFFYTSGKIHHVKIGPLEPSTVYYYRCGGVDDEYSFKTPPAKLPIELAVIGDLGQTEWTASTLSHVNATSYDMLLLPGDLSYADGQQPLWDTFGRFVSPYASSRPWMVTEGNHETETFLILHPSAFDSYNARWQMPHEESGSGSNLYYSFDAAGGAVHVVMLGSYTDFGVGSEQYRWVKADLVKVDRGRTPWVVVLLHAPWYNTNLAHQGEGESMRVALEEVLYEAGVDVVFAGHVHAYERFTRVYDNAADPCGPVHVTIRDGGNREGLALSFDKNHKSKPLSAFREASFGHGRLRVLNGTHAVWSWHRNDDAQSTVRDQVVLESLSGSRACKVGRDEHQPSSSTTSTGAAADEEL